MCCSIGAREPTSFFQKAPLSRMKVTKYLRLLAVFDCYIFIYFFLAVTQHSVQLNFIYTASVNIRINKKKNSLSRGRNLQQDKPHMGVGDVLTVIVD